MTYFDWVNRFCSLSTKEYTLDLGKSYGFPMLEVGSSPAKLYPINDIIIESPGFEYIIRFTEFINLWGYTHYDDSLAIEWPNFPKKLLHGKVESDSVILNVSKSFSPFYPKDMPNRAFSMLVYMQDFKLASYGKGTNVARWDLLLNNVRERTNS